MHQIPASVNAFCAWLVALHFWPIFDPSSLKTAEIRHFPSASAAKTVELESNVRLRPPLFLVGAPSTSLILWSERPDSNRRPLDPQSSALPSCATLRPGRRPKPMSRRSSPISHHC